MGFYIKGLTSCVTSVSKLWVQHLAVAGCSVKMANSDRERTLWQCIYTDNAEGVEDLLLSCDSEECAQLINQPLDFTHDLKKARESIPVPDSLLRERLDIRRPWCLCGMFQARNVASVLLKVRARKISNLFITCNICYIQCMIL